jgi:hypothetical protein
MLIINAGLNNLKPTEDDQVVYSHIRETLKPSGFENKNPNHCGKHATCCVELISAGVTAGVAPSAVAGKKMTVLPIIYFRRYENGKTRSA